MECYVHGIFEYMMEKKEKSIRGQEAIKPAFYFSAGDLKLISHSNEVAGPSGRRRKVFFHG